MKFRKKPVVIEAFQYRLGGFGAKVENFYKEFVEAVCEKAHNGTYGEPHIHTLEGSMDVKLQDWIIKGINGEFYPCKPDIFEKTYEPVK